MVVDVAVPAQAGEEGQRSAANLLAPRRTEGRERTLVSARCRGSTSARWRAQSPAREKERRGGLDRSVTCELDCVAPARPAPPARRNDALRLRERSVSGNGTHELRPTPQSPQPGLHPASAQPREAVAVAARRYVIPVSCARSFGSAPRSESEASKRAGGRPTRRGETDPRLPPWPLRAPRDVGSI